MNESGELLRVYASSASETAFAELVSRYVNLVYSTALRLVRGDSHLAQEISQNVFTDMARMAGSLSSDVMLGGWLHRHTCYLAQKALRTEHRRAAREAQAAQMNEPEEESSLAALAPILDEAINKLGGEDRRAILLRYFEEKDFRAVGESLGSSEEAARKRVNRALEKLRALLTRRGVVLSAAALGAALETEAVTAAPAAIAGGLAASALAAASAGGGTALTTLYFMSMTKMQAGVIAAVTLALSIPLVLQYRGQARLKQEIESLRAETGQIAGLKAENARLSNLVAAAQHAAPAPKNDEQFHELMKLRGEVGTLRRTATEAEAVVSAGKESPLSGITANPEMNKAIRNQQKLGLSMIYKGLTNHAKITPEKAGALTDLLADKVMANIDHVQAGLREGKNLQEMEQTFKAEQEATDQKVKDLLGDEAFAQYKEYNQNLLSTITADQFKSMMLTGEKAAKDELGHKLYDLLQQEKQNALANAGLPADFQLVPTMNFQNFASDEAAERNLQLLDSVYGQVQDKAAAFLSPEQLQKFGEFRKMAINNNRVALAVNRKLMAPAAPAR